MIHMTAPEISNRLKEIYKSFSGEMDIFSFILLEHPRTKSAIWSDKDIDKVKSAIHLMACMINSKCLLDELFLIMDWNTLYLVNQTIKNSIEQLAGKYHTLKCDVPEEDNDFFKVYSCFSLDTLQNS